MNSFFVFLKNLIFSPFRIKKSNTLINSKIYVNRKNSFSIKDLDKIGLSLKSITRQITDKENVVTASQLPTHIFPWVLNLKKGFYRITFSPEVLSQINSGALAVSGGVARNTSGQIVAIGRSISPDKPSSFRVPFIS